MLVPRNGDPTRADGFFDVLPEAQSGPLTFDPAKVRSAYQAARAVASEHLARLHREVVDAYSTNEGIVPQLQDFGLAWVRGV